MNITESANPWCGWSSCALTVAKVSGSIWAGIAIFGGLRDNWKVVMMQLGMGFWANIVCSAILAGIGASIFCHVSQCMTSTDEVKVLRRHAKGIAMATALSAVALLLAIATPESPTGALRIFAYIWALLSASGEVLLGTIWLVVPLGRVKTI
ncbi:hypothetical protein [Paucibacter soli]|uniref:hypothetical protein n=1 Tax=Paucibacter soli TaxID=3133433 RepID=UPI0030AEFA55